MSRRSIEPRTQHHAPLAPWDNDPDPDPEPPIAPPVIILAKNSPLRTTQELEPHVGPAFETQPHTSSRSRANPAAPSKRYNLRSKPWSHPDPDPDPDPAPEPEPAPPIIILSNKRPASGSPSRSTTPSASTNSTPPHHTPVMGSKASKISRGGKLQPSLAKADKAEMKEPSNYYTHRSKSMRRKAGKGTGSAGGGASGQTDAAGPI